MFLFIFVSNWSGALLPWGIIKLPHGKLAAPTNDICFKFKINNHKKNGKYNLKTLSFNLSFFQPFDSHMISRCASFIGKKTTYNII